jgi:sigma-E factor negative regulatory protein RseC
MIEEHAKVIEVLDAQLVIEASRNSACGKCAANSDCTQSSIAQWAASRMVNIVVDKPHDLVVSVGDTIIVGIDENSFVKASAAIYLLPLLIMFFAGWGSSAMGFAEWVVISVSFTGLLLSFYIIKLLSKIMEKNATYQLNVLSILK